MSIHLMSGVDPALSSSLSSARKGQSALTTCLAILALCACSSTGGEGTPGSGGSAGKAGGNGGSSSGGQVSAGGTMTNGFGGATGNGGSPGNGGTQSGSGGQNNNSGGQNNSSSGGQNNNSGGQSATGGKSASGGSSSGGGSSAGASTGGSGGSASHRDHCIDGYDPDPSDDTMKDGLVEFTKSGQIDTIVQPGVITWMQNHVWEEAHFQWHNIRRCNGGMVDRTRDGGLDPCTHKDLVPADQEFKTDGDGLQFLAMHRHMIQSLKQLFPKHTEQFEGWDHYPQKASDVPPEWQADWKAWASNIATNLAKADDPASHMNESGFENEGAFGQWIQSAMPKSGIHGALHFNWVRTNNSEHGLGNQYTNIDNYMFWKMHGWIDKVWDRYRAAKGKKPTDQDIKDAVLQQCRGMDALVELVKPGASGNNNGSTCTAAPKQTGTFVTSVRTIFESSTNKCTGCHGPQGASANLTLGGSDCVKSSDIVAALVNKPSTTGGQYKLIVPGDPDHSWLYLKVTGKAGTVTCTPTGGNQCITDTMPQGSMVTLTQAEQDALKKWIQDGATAPQ